MLSNKHKRILTSYKDTSLLELYAVSVEGYPTPKIINGYLRSEGPLKITNLIDENNDQVFQNQAYLPELNQLLSERTDSRLIIKVISHSEDTLWSLEFDDPSYHPPVFSKIHFTDPDLDAMTEIFFSHIKRKYNIGR